MAIYKAQTDESALALLGKRMAAFIDENGVELKLGATEIIQLLHDKGYKTAVATASPVKRTPSSVSAVEMTFIPLK